MHDPSWALPVRTPPNLGTSKQQYHSLLHSISCTTASLFLQIKSNVASSATVDKDAECCQHLLAMLNASFQTN